MTLCILRPQGKLSPLHPSLGFPICPSIMCVYYNVHTYLCLSFIQCTVVCLLLVLWSPKLQNVIISNQIGAPGVKIVDGCNCWFYQFDSLHQLVSSRICSMLSNRGSCDAVKCVASCEKESIQCGRIMGLIFQVS